MNSALFSFTAYLCLKLLIDGRFSLTSRSPPNLSLYVKVVSQCTRTNAPWAHVSVSLDMVTSCCLHNVSSGHFMSSHLQEQGVDTTEFMTSLVHFHLNLVRLLGCCFFSDSLLRYGRICIRIWESEVGNNFTSYPDFRAETFALNASWSEASRYQNALQLNDTFLSVKLQNTVCSQALTRQLKPQLDNRSLSMLSGSG